MPAPVTYAQRRATCRRFTSLAIGGTPSAAHLRALAEKYEKGYRRARTSKRPPKPHHLRGMCETARAFYSLAREAQRAHG